MLPWGGAGRGKGCSPSGRIRQGQRLRSLGEGQAGAKTALLRDGAGRGKDCASSARVRQGQRLRSLGKGQAGAKTALPWGGAGMPPILTLPNDKSNLKALGSLLSKPEVSTPKADNIQTASNRPRIHSSIVRNGSTHNAFWIAIAQFRHFST